MKSEKEIIWKRYKLFYISQSTAFITPVLYIFAQEYLQLKPSMILQISALYWLLSVFFQLPCGIIADRWGVKLNLSICLLLQISSCISLVIFKNEFAYNAYLICIYLAQCFSTSNNVILIRQQFKVNDNEKFKEFQFQLQNDFYKTTSLIIVISSLLYTVDPIAPFLFQIVTFCFAGYNLSKIPDQNVAIKKQDNIFKCARNDIQRSLFNLFNDRSYQFLFICMIFFGLGVTINQKTIQNQLFSLFDKNQVIYIGLVIAAGNLFSSIGSKFFYKLISKISHEYIEIIVLCFLLIFSYLLMSVSHVYFVVFGFMTLNVFKGCYRPLLSAEMVNRYPFKKSLSTNSALIFSLSVAFSSILQFVISTGFNNLESGNTLFAVLTFVVVMGSFAMTCRPSKWSLSINVNTHSGKKSFIERAGNKVYFTQIYTPSPSKERLDHILKAIQSGRYPAKPVEIFQDFQGNVGIRTEYLQETHLSDILDRDLQYRFCQKLLQMAPQLTGEGFQNAQIPSIQYILRPKSFAQIQKEPLLTELTLIHGDLHPENIIVVDGNPFVIDWDLAGQGPYWYDLLSLLSHPYLLVEKRRRYELFLQHCRYLNEEDLDTIFFHFCHFKQLQLTALSSQVEKYVELADLYSIAKNGYAPTTSKPLDTPIRV